MTTVATRGPQLHIDPTRCDGHGLCAVLLDRRIALDEWGYPMLRGGPVGPDEMSAVRRAVAACPALALRLETPHLESRHLESPRLESPRRQTPRPQDTRVQGR
jgi:ferredoxin